MIKKYNITVILSLLLMALVSSCRNDFNGNPAVEDPDGKLILNIGMNFPDMQTMQTRSLLADTPETPTGEYLSELAFYIFVFEDNGAPEANYLRELVYGSDIQEITADGNKVKFKVKSNGTAENAILHIVATNDSENFENQLKSVPDRSEFGIFAGASGLYTTSYEAYWKRIELDMPINSDNIKTEVFTDKLTDISMIRNCLRITMKMSDDEEAQFNGFNLDAFTVVNAVDHGYVAAYNEYLGADGKPGFVEFEKIVNDQKEQKAYKELLGENYVPARHPAAARVNADDNLSDWVAGFENGTSDECNNDPKYMFERSIQTDNRTYIVIKGHYNNDTNDKRYFKIDIGTIDNETKGDDGEPFGIFEQYHLIRNISYDITITNVAVNAGHKSVESALASYPANNISTSIETRPLTSINDGVDKMEINKQTYIIIDDDEGNPVPASIEMKWNYIKDFKDTKILYSDHVKWNYPGYELKFDDDGKDPDGIFDHWVDHEGGEHKTTPIYQKDGTNESTDYGDNWRGFELHFNKPDNITRQKTIRLYSPEGLTRDVEFIMHKRWEFVTNDEYKDKSNIEVYPGHYSPSDLLSKGWHSLDDVRQHVEPGKVGSLIGAPLTVMFELPADLPQALFPLDFKIGFDRQNVENAYAGNAVVVWGDTMFDGDEEDYIPGVPRMQFVKTVQWNEYQQQRVVCARFSTITDVIDNNPDIGQFSITRVRVTNPYFTLGEDDFLRDATGDLDGMMRWYWNFSYQNWVNYFNEAYTDTGAAGSFDGLEFNNYTRNGSAMVIGTENASSVYNDNIYDFKFDIDDNIETSNTNGKITIIASSNQDGKRTGNLGNYTWNRYNRKVYIRIIFTDNTSQDITNMDEFTDDGEDNYTNAFGATTAYIETKTREVTFEIDANKKIKQVVIWSVNGTSQKTSGSGKTVINYGPTRYYSIRMELTPKP